MNTAIKRAQTLAGHALEQAAQSGVARAIASRQAAGIELNVSDIDQVSGGFMSEVMPCGGKRIDAGLVSSPITNPVLPAEQIGALQNVGMVV